MHLFEKIFNHQILARLEDTGAYMVTSHERAWLKTMLVHPAAEAAFTSETLVKLRGLLEPDPVLDVAPHLLEKARSREQQVYHPLLRTLHRLILQQAGVRLTYEIKSGRLQSEQSGLPYKLEYSMVKREWYLLWIHVRHRAFMSTRLKHIHAAAAEWIEPELAADLLASLGKRLETQKNEVVIEIVPLYNEELSRILYAFSSFEKTVEYSEEANRYRVRVTLLGDEMEYLLSRIRFLGKRVRVAEGAYLKKRMLESSTKALERYGVSEETELEQGGAS